MMIIILNVLSVIGVLGIGFSFYMLWRNEEVRKIRLKIVEILHAEKNYILYDRGPSYDQMLNQFWKPITLKYWLAEFRK